MDKSSKLFGTVPRTEILLLLYALGQSTFSQLAERLDLPPSLVQRYLEDLHEEGVVQWSKAKDKKTTVFLNAGYSAYKELTALLNTLGSQSPKIREAASKKL